MLKEVADDICWLRFTQELLSHHGNECPRKRSKVLTMRG